MAASMASMMRSAAPRAGQGLSTARQFSTQKLPDLPYDYSALEPVISGEIMELHHSKHHATYIANFNAAAEQQAVAENKGDLSKLISLQPAIKFNGGGNVNHSIFWTNLTPPKDFEPPSGDLAKAIEVDFGSVDNLISKFNPKAAAVQGSGWGWLGYSKEAGKLVIATTANQDPLITQVAACGLQGLVPLLGIDVWEHAYYLQYKNKRPDYLKEVWKVVNWKNVGERLAAAKA